MRELTTMLFRDRYLNPSPGSIVTLITQCLSTKEDLNRFSIAQYQSLIFASTLTLLQAQAEHGSKQVTLSLSTCVPMYNLLETRFKSNHNWDIQERLGSICIISVTTLIV